MPRAAFVTGSSARSEYEQVEKVIRQLLTEARHPASGALVSVEGTGAEAAADWKNLRSPESYLGYARAESLVSPGRATPDRPRDYAAPAVLRLNQWALTGNWTQRMESAVSTRGQREDRASLPRARCSSRPA